MKISNALPWNWSIFRSKAKKVKEEAKEAVTDDFGHGHDMNPLAVGALQTLRFGSLIGLPILGAFLAEFYVLSPLRGLSDRAYRMAMVGAGALAGTAIFILIGRVLRSAEVVEFKNPDTGEWEKAHAPRELIESLIRSASTLQMKVDSKDRTLTQVTNVNREVLKLLSADPEQHNDLLEIAKEIAAERGASSEATQKLNRIISELGIDPASDDVVDLVLRFRQDALDAKETAEEFRRQVELGKKNKLPEGIKYDAEQDAIVVTRKDHAEAIPVERLMRAAELTQKMISENTPEVVAKHEGGGWYNVLINGEPATDDKVRRDQAEALVAEVHMRLENGSINPADPGFEAHAKEIILAALQSGKAVPA